VENKNLQSASSNNQIPDSPGQPIGSGIDIGQPATTTSINPDSLPPGIKLPTGDPSKPEQIQVQPAGKFPIFKLKFLIVAVFVILIIAGATGGYLFF